MAARTLVRGTARANAATNAFRLPGSAYVPIDDPFDGSGADLVEVSAQESAADAARMAQLSPRRGVQEVGWRVYLDGARIDHLLTGSAIQVTRGIEQPVQLASFETVALDGISPIGSILSTGAPGPGLRHIDIKLEFRPQDGSAAFEEPVITGGIAEAQQRRFGAVVLDSLSIADKEKLYLEVRATKRLPAGHNTSRGALMEQLAVARGWSASSVDIQGVPGVVQKPVDLVEGDALSLERAIGEPVGAFPVVSRLGEHVVRFNAPEREQRNISWVWTAADIVSISAVSVTITPAPEAWTRVSLRGSEQITRGSDCGLETIVLESVSRAPTNGNPLAFQQDNAGNVTATGIVPNAPQEKVVSETILEITEECGTEISILQTTRTMFNPQATRYLRDTSGTVIGHRTNTTYLASNVASPNSGETGRVYVAERLIETQEVQEAFTYDSDGFLTKRVKETRGWYNPRRHVKSRTSLSTTWESETADTNWRDTGNGEAVLFDQDVYGLVSRETETNDHDALGFLETRTVTVEGYGAPPGLTYLYGDGSTRSEPQESFRVLSRSVDTYTRVDEARRIVKKTTVTYGIDGSDPRTEVTDERSQPAAPRKQNVEPRSEDFSDAGDLARARAALRFENREMKAECSAPNLLLVRPERELVEAAIEWAETPAELQQVCRRLILAGQAPEITFVVPANPAIEEGQWGHIVGPPGSQLNADVKVVQVSHAGPMQGPILTTVSAVAYPAP